MSRYRTRSWRAFDPAAAPPPAASVCVRILGLDPGSRRTGFGVIECRGGEVRPVTHGCINVTAATHPARLRLIFEGLRALLSEHGPSEVAVERVFVSRNPDSALKLGQARGAALCAIPAEVPVFEYAPRAIKLAVVGSGGAEKFQVAQMIRTILSLAERPAADAADALAVAVCHAHQRQLHARIHCGGGPYWSRA
ncbi:MAG: crossover junction endodeoxyribonuclease RuvC [Gammaproteobacteria bacterium]|nr:crossover junction endodeoxyribonuclease RuvC [Gammaproteobacteria bacterium]MBV8403208.1 crossover junction endodeoxyribonuclease RuvC [Gammaproteobacteria bacterium]